MPPPELDTPSTSEHPAYSSPPAGTPVISKALVVKWGLIFIVPIALGALFNSTGLIWFLWIGVAFYHWLKARPDPALLRKAEDDKFASVLATTLDRVDYFYVDKEVGGIMLDAKNRKFAVFSVTGKGRALAVAQPLTYRIEDIKGYLAHEPEYYEQKVYGGPQPLGMSLDNLRERRKAENATGLYIDVDDIVHPRHFVRMKGPEARGWSLVLEKCADGTLPLCDSPTRYPIVQPK